MARLKIDEKEKTLLMGIMVGIVTIIPGFISIVISNSVALLSDFVRSLTETFIMIISLVIYQSTKRFDSNIYNYGLGKLENLVGITVAVFLMFSAMYILYNSLHRIHSPTQLHDAWIGIVLTLIYMNTNGFLYFKNRRVRIKDNSMMMYAQEKLFLMKLLANFNVFLGLTISTIFAQHPWALFVDPICAIILVLFMFVNIFDVLKQSIFGLLDRSIDVSCQRLIHEILNKHRMCYKKFYGIRTRYVGNKMIVDVKLSFNDNILYADLMDIIKMITDEISINLKNCDIQIIVM